MKKKVIKRIVDKCFNCPANGPALVDDPRFYRYCFEAKKHMIWDDIIEMRIFYFPAWCPLEPEK